MATAREIMDRLTEAVEAGEVAGITALYDPAAVFTAPEGTFRGAEQIEEYWRALMGAVSDVGVEVRARFGTGDTAIDEWTLGAVHSGPLETPAGTATGTGRTITLRGADVLRVEGGRIVEHRAYYDQVELLSQVGLLAIPA